MGTRSNMASVDDSMLSWYLYREMHDDATHLEITQLVEVKGRVVSNNSYLNIVIPPCMVEDMKSFLLKHPTETRQ